MVSIIPGIENLAPLRTETSSGSFASPRRLPISSRAARARWSISASISSGSAPLLLLEEVAGGRRDGEAGRDRQAGVRHLRQAGALAAQRVLHALVAVRLAAAEEVDVLGHSSTSESRDVRDAIEKGHGLRGQEAQPVRADAEGRPPSRARRRRSGPRAAQSRQRAQPRLVSAIAAAEAADRAVQVRLPHPRETGPGPRAAAPGRPGCSWRA